MAFLLIFGSIYLPLFALTFWFQRRLQAAVVARHPGAAHMIDRMTRPAPRSQRMLNRISRYRLLNDPEVDRHLRNLARVEKLLGYAVLGFFAFVLVMIALKGGR